LINNLKCWTVGADFVDKGNLFHTWAMLVTVYFSCICYAILAD